MQIQNICSIHINRNILISLLYILSQFKRIFPLSDKWRSSSSYKFCIDYQFFLLQIQKMNDIFFNAF